MFTPTEKQLELMQHALGLKDRNRVPYRNRFLAEEPCPHWEALVVAGLAQARKTPERMVDGVYYNVTAEGEAQAIAALPPGKKPTRYSRWLDGACESMTFKEYILGDQAPRLEVGPKGMRMFRVIKDFIDACGEWSPDKRTAKESYKAALEKARNS